MPILNTQSRVRYWPLKGDQGEAPTWAANSIFNFRMNSIPLITRGNLANYVPALAVTAFGTVNTDGSDATTYRLGWEDIVNGLFASFDLQGAWHGRPLAAQHMRGSTARIWELISMGYQSGGRHMAGISSSATAKSFRVTLYLPLCHALGRNGARYTSQLALLFQDAHLEISTAASSTNSLNGKALTFTSVTMRCSAVLLPEASIRLAPGTEWLEFQQAGAVTSSDTVDLVSLGNATALEGVEPGAGIDTMLALCNPTNQNLLGSFALSTLTRFSAPFIDQTQTVHLDPFIDAISQVSSKGQRPRDQVVEDYAGTATPAAVGRVVDTSGFPNMMETIATGAGGSGANLDSGGLFFPLIVSGPELEITKLQKFEGTASYYRTVTVGSSTVDRTLLHQYKSWTPQKHKDFRDLVIQSKMAAQVLGTSDIVEKAVRNEMGPPMDPSRARFFPIEYVPNTGPQQKAPA
jgi:hypothetical protein